MAVRFDISTYDILQRAISTADALNELGTEPVEASYEAAETVFDDREDSVAEEAYITEWIIGTGPPIDSEVVAAQMERDAEETETAREVVHRLALAVLTSAVHSDTFDADTTSMFDGVGEPLEEYDAKPEKILSLFVSEAKAFNSDGGAASPEEAASEAVDTHRDKLEQLTFTALCIVVDHLHCEYDIDPEVEVEVEGVESITEVGIDIFEAALCDFLAEVSDEEYD